MEKRSAVAFVVAILAFAAPASADWVHQKSDDPFQGDQHLALDVDFSGFTVGFRCTNAGDLTLVFIMPEKPRDEMMKTADEMPLELATIIDDEPKVEIPAQLSSTPDGENIRAESKSSADVVAIAEAAALANRRVAIAATLFGKVVYSHSFDADGSTAAIKALLKGCNIASNPGDAK